MKWPFVSRKEHEQIVDNYRFHIRLLGELMCKDIQEKVDAEADARRWRMKYEDLLRESAR